MIQFHEISKSFGPKNLFSEVTFSIGHGERVGFVGRNGSGKSTLFKLIKGEMDVDSGRVQIPSGYTIGSIDQHIHFEKQDVLSEVMSVLSEEEQWEEYRAEKILQGLGFSKEDQAKDPMSFSGGFQIRINLAKVIIKSPSLLLLDEPTNYLDIISLKWLSQYLKQYPGEVFFITHDRSFMDAVATHTAGIHRGKVKKIKGDTEKFYSKIFEEEENYEKTRLNQEKKEKHLVSFIDRFRAKATKAKQAQSRLKQLDKMNKLEQLEDISEMNLQFHYSKIAAKFILSVEDLQFGYTDELLINNLSFQMGAKDRIGIIGKNGKGKSTLLNVLNGFLKEKSGQYNFHPKADISFFGQTNVEALHANHTILQEIQLANPDLGQSSQRAICGAMMFSNEDALKKISVLSGGEKARVLLGKIMAQKSNILLLDEPTNHLDIESVEILTEELEKFPGALLLVTHNENLLKRLATKLIIFREGNCEFYNGDYEDFLKRVGWEEDETKQIEKKTENKKVGTKERQAIISERAKMLRPLREKIEERERQITGLELLLKDETSKLELAYSQDDQQVVRDSSERIGKINKKIEEIFEEICQTEEDVLHIEEKFVAKLKDFN